MENKYYILLIDTNILAIKYFGKNNKAEKMTQLMLLNVIIIIEQGRSILQLSNTSDWTNHLYLILH